MVGQAGSALGPDIVTAISRRSGSPTKVLIRDGGECLLLGLLRTAIDIGLAPKIDPRPLHVVVHFQFAEGGVPRDIRFERRSPLPLA